MQDDWKKQANEPVAYIFELASNINHITGEYGGWKEYIQVDKPHVPPKSIRNLRPLYAGALQEK